jgi:hypothetical protein
VSVAGAVALDGFTVSQGEPVVVVALALKIIVPPDPVTVRVLLSGVPPDAAWLNESEVGDTPSVAVAVTFKVTPTLCGLLATFAGFVAIIVTVPL